MPKYDVEVLATKSVIEQIEVDAPDEQSARELARAICGEVHPWAEEITTDSCEDLTPIKKEGK